jgi:hypothetical protein
MDPLWFAKLNKTGWSHGGRGSVGEINSASTAAMMRTIMILPSRVKATLYLLGNRCIQRVSLTQLMLGCQHSSLLTHSHISATTIAFRSCPKVVAKPPVRIEPLRDHLIAPRLSYEILMV